MKTYLIAALLVAIAFGIVQSPSAEVVRFDFSGRITGIEDSDNVLTGTGITVNVSTFTGTIIYDSDATPIDLPSPYEALYPGVSLTLVIDDSITTSSSNPDVKIYNDIPNSDTQWVDVVECEEQEANDISSNLPESINRIDLALVSYLVEPGGPLTGMQLPLNINLDEFTDNRLIVIEGVDSLLIEGEIDTLERFYPDDDDDGVPNYLDICPNTLAGLIIKGNGCIEGDYDNDGDVDGGDLGEFSNQFGIQP